MMWSRLGPWLILTSGIDVEFLLKESSYFTFVTMALQIIFQNLRFENVISWL